MKRDLSFREVVVLKPVLISIAVTLSLLFLTEPTITYDGWQYISSGRSIFDGTFGSNYFLLRQPIYPFFVGLCLEIYNSLYFVEIMQILINLISLNFLFENLYKYSFLKSSRYKKLSKVFSFVIIYFYLGSYPSFILAQNLFMPVISIFLFLLLIGNIVYKLIQFLFFLKQLSHLIL